VNLPSESVSEVRASPPKIMTCARGIASPVRELTTTPVTVQRGAFLLFDGCDGLDKTIWPGENAEKSATVIASTPELKHLCIHSPWRGLRAKARDYLTVIPVKTP
jgi:hypothetical protein